MNRRKFLLTVGTGTVAAIAGCSDDGGGSGSSGDTSSPTAVVDSYYNIIADFGPDPNPDDVLNEIEPLLHSASPIPDIINESNPDQTTPQEQKIDSVDTEVTQEDLSAQELQSQGLGLFGTSQDEIDSIAEENALVTATVTHEDGTTEETEHITATEGGDWLIVF